MTITAPKLVAADLNSGLILTVSEFESLASDFPLDLVQGKVQLMPPPGGLHGVVCGNVYFSLSAWSRATRTGIVVSNDTAVVTETDPDSVRGSDVAFISWERLPGRRVPQGAFRTPPNLVVEVLSPSDVLTNVMGKVREYLHCGVIEVWIVDAETRTVSIYLREQPVIELAETDTLTRPDLLPGFSCPVAEFFADI